VALTAAVARLGVARIVGLSLHSGPRRSAGETLWDRSRRWVEFLQQKCAGDCLNDGESDSNIRFCLPFSGILRENPTDGDSQLAWYARSGLAGFECECRMLKETGAPNLPGNRPFPAIREIHRDLP